MLSSQVQKVQKVLILIFWPGGVKSADECQLSAHMREALIFPGVHTGCLFGCECDVQGAQETDSS